MICEGMDGRNGLESPLLPGSPFGGSGNILPAGGRKTATKVAVTKKAPDKFRRLLVLLKYC